MVGAGHRGSSASMRRGVGMQHRAHDRRRPSHHPLRLAPRLDQEDGLPRTGLRESLEDLFQRRAGLVEALSALDARGWSRGATFTATTLGREATVLSYARRIADHEAQHMDQLHRTLER